VIKFLFAFCVGLAFSLWLAARDARRNSPWSRSLGVWPALAWLSTLLAFGVGGWMLFQWSQRSIAESAPLEAPSPTDVAPSRAARLLIPSLALNALIVDVPVRNGSWNVDWLGTDVGRLESMGTRPGDDLAMVFTGHVTLSALERGPFADLWTIQPWDEIIYRGEGTDFVYAVSGVSTIAPGDVDRLYVSEGDNLLLVTCTDWDYVHEIYRQRLLVRAVLVKQVSASTLAP
jgi:LPXTG-site transpeptidase (sortase) family protein